MKNNSILVAGGAGFLGSHLIDRLIPLSKKILCVDNLKTGDEKNIAHLTQLIFSQSQDELTMDFIRNDNPIKVINISVNDLLIIIIKGNKIQI